ncbi:MAG: anti-sigma factor [Acidobacteria bacterium]|nr:anti-sigma factor [Acidobacteriota bacterium]MBI3423240.1 anti-sigma factor [Acidobacteriota bacterium]
MICPEAQDLLHAYHDGELDLVRSLAFERHLQTCQTCAQRYQTQQALRSAITTGGLYYQTPAKLQRRVQSAARETNQTEPNSWPVWWRWLGVGASLAAIAVLILTFRPWLTRPAAADLVTQEIISAHVRSLMAEHLTDVASSDRHTVKPWFNGRLDFSPPVTDLTERGFPLIGGRLDYLNNRPVAALVYRRQQHIINLFVWPSTQTSPNIALNPVTRQGYHLFRWVSAGLIFLAISDLNEKELAEFVQLARTQTSPLPAAAAATPDR